MLSMGKSTISMAIFNSYVKSAINPMKCPFSYGFSYDFPMVFVNLPEGIVQAGATHTYPMNLLIGQPGLGPRGPRTWAPGHHLSPLEFNLS